MRSGARNYSGMRRQLRQQTGREYLLRTAHRAASTTASLLAPSSASSAPSKVHRMAPAVVPPSAVIANMRSTPFPWLFSQFIERGGVAYASVLVSHPEAPHPLALLKELLFHLVPPKAIMVELLRAAIQLEQSQLERSRQLSAGGASGGDASSVGLASMHPSCFGDRSTPPSLFVHAVSLNPTLESDRDVCNLLVLYLLTQRMYAGAARILLAMRHEDVTVAAWNAMLRPIRRAHFRDYRVLEYLMSPTHFPKEKFVLSAEAASECLTNGGLVGQLSPLVAAHVIDRYLAHVDREEEEMRRTLPPHRAASVRVEVHPTPFLVFFGVVSAQRHPERRYTLLHWEHCWRYFQTLNARCPQWFESSCKPEEAEHLCKFMLSNMALGANPWMTLNVARWAARRHIVDGVEIAIWMLHRLSPAHHPDEAREIARRLFEWLIGTVGIHAHPQHARHVIPAARVLISLGMHSHLARLHTAMIDHLFDATPEFREEFVAVFEDLACSMCNTLLDETNVHTERCCQNCMYVVPAKPRELPPSFSLTPARLELSKKRSKQRGKAAVGVIRGSLETLSLSRAQAKQAAPGKEQSKRSPRPPLDAAEIFRRQVLQSSVPLVPGVAAPEEHAAGGAGQSKGAGAASLLDRDLSPQEVQQAMEDAVRRVDLQRAAREYIHQLRQQNVTGSIDKGGDAVLRLTPSMSPPTRRSLPSSDSLSVATSSSPFAPEVRQSSPSGAAAGQALMSVQWTCIWCQEANALPKSPVVCRACGAETGPAASWRSFKYSSTFDVMAEVRGRINNAMNDPTEGVVAAFYLMLYRKTFLLRAVASDYVLIDRLIRLLVEDAEHVLAAFLYTRVVPPRRRKVDDTLRALSSLFLDGGAPAASERQEASLSEVLADVDLTNDSVFFPAVFGSKTCKLCFGTHDWRSCPIITRDFSEVSSTIKFSTSAEERARAHMAKVAQAIRNAAAAAAAASASASGGVAGAAAAAGAAAVTAREAIFGAYKLFIASPQREEIAAAHAEEVNQLSLELSKAMLFRRAAFVLCHVPYHKRANDAYYAFVPYFGVTRADCEPMLRTRKLDDAASSHPNFVQVAMTCCMCLDDRHASFKCDKLANWLESCFHACLPRSLQGLFVRGGTDSGDKKGGSGAKGSTNAPAPAGPPSDATLRAQVDGWCSSGPERLFSFHRFLIHSLDKVVAAARGHYCSLSDGRTVVADVFSEKSPVVYAFNKCITQLFMTEKASLGLRLLAISPREVIAKETIITAVRCAGAGDQVVGKLQGLSMAALWEGSDQWSAYLMPASAQLHKQLRAGTSAAASVEAAPTETVCLVCFSLGHTFHTCPEVTHLSHVARITRTAQALSAIRMNSIGVSAAADFLAHAHITMQLSPDMLRVNPPLAQVVLDIAARCLARRMPHRALRLLRRVPIHMVPMELYSALWKAAGMSEDNVTAHVAKLEHLFDRHSLRPPPVLANDAVAKVSALVPSDFQITPEFLRSYSALVAGQLCRQCCHSGHHVTACELFRYEAAFGRDFIAVFRTVIISESFTPAQSQRLVAKLTKFLLLYRNHMPYYVLGVQRAANALSAINAIHGRPGVGLRVLLAIPASQRMRHVFLQLLHAFGVPKDECIAKMHGFLVTGDATSSGQHTSALLSDQTPDGDNGGRRGNGAAHDDHQQHLSSMADGDSIDAEMDFRINPDHLLNHRAPIPDVAMNLFAHVAGAKDALAAADDVVLRLAAGEDRPRGTPRGATILPAQNATIETIRDAFAPIQDEVQRQVGVKLGSQHPIFSQGIEILRPEHESGNAEPEELQGDV